MGAMVKQLEGVWVCERSVIHVLDERWIKREKLVLRELDPEDFGGKFVSFL